MSQPATKTLGVAARTRTVSSCADSTERSLFMHPTGRISKGRKNPRPARSISGDQTRKKRPRVPLVPAGEDIPEDHIRPVRPQPPLAHQEGIPSYRPWETSRRNRVSDMCNLPPPDHDRSTAVAKRERSDVRAFRQTERNDARASRHAERPDARSARQGGRTVTASIPRRDDADGHLIFKLGDGLYATSEYPNGRYKILSSLGEGTFGKVVECWDRRVCRRVAVKIVRSISKYREAAKLEIDVLLHLSSHDPEGICHCVKMYSWFDHFSHVCMVFEKLGPSLYEHLRKNRFQPFSIDEVRTYAFQLLESVSFVHSLTLIHTDLKPENILLVNSNNNQSIKLIDFGSATFEAEHHSTVISTRHYRAPEVILGLGWTYPCDLWSVGCILVELYTGQALFQTHENLEHLAMMSVVLGPIPQTMIHRADSSCQEYFLTKPEGRSELNWPQGASSKGSIRSVRRVKSLSQIVRVSDGHSNFLDLLRRLLAFEPETRCTSEEALSHPFFNEAPVESDHPTTTMNESSGSSACATGRDGREARRPPRVLSRSHKVGERGGTYRQDAGTSAYKDAVVTAAEKLPNGSLLPSETTGQRSVGKPTAGPSFPQSQGGNRNSGGRWRGSRSKSGHVRKRKSSSKALGES